jgi:hypothetical protein
LWAEEKRPGFPPAFGFCIILKAYTDSLTLGAALAAE